MLVMGIDPGKNGAVVALDCETGAVMQVFLMPQDPYELVESVTQQDGPFEIFIEKAQPMPKNGAVSMFNYGRDFGTLLGIFLCAGVRHTLVPPATWTRVMHAGATGGEAKARSLEVVRRLFPGQDLRKPGAERAKKPHDGIIDALLIAEYGRRLLTRA